MIRVGQGFDVHRFQEGRPLILGGVRIPHSRGLIGHSDADVLLHAVTDAVLGALGKGDIGTYFPDTDPAYKDADSAGSCSGSGRWSGALDTGWAMQMPRSWPSTQDAPPYTGHAQADRRIVGGG